MLQQIRYFLVVICITGFIGYLDDGSVFSINMSYAAEESAAARKKTRRIPTMSESTYKKLAEAQELIDLKELAPAAKVLHDMLESRRRPLNGNETGQVHNILGFLYFSMEDYERAIYHYRIVANQGDKIPEGLEVTTLYTLAQLSFVAERFQDALDYMVIWLSKAENPGPDPHIFMGQVYYQMEDFPRAIEQIERGVAVAQERGTEVKENWWSLLNYLYYEQENWPKVLEVLGILVRDFPKREYWIQLAGIHGQEGQEIEQLGAMEAAHVGDYLEEERDFTTLAGLLMQAEAPYRAAKVLDRGLRDGVIEKTSTNLRSLGQAWQLSQETKKAIQRFEEAGKAADDGKIYERLSALYLDNDEFPKCVTAANNALRKGGLRKKQNVYVIRGMCEYNRDRLTTARKSFASCRNESRRAKDKGNTRICQQWMTYIDRELARRRALQNAS